MGGGGLGQKQQGHTTDTSARRTPVQTCLCSFHHLSGAFAVLGKASYQGVLALRATLHAPLEATVPVPAGWFPTHKHTKWGYKNIDAKPLYACPQLPK